MSEILRGGRPSHAGRAAEAVRQVRSDDPSGQDTAGAVWAAEPLSPTAGFGGGNSTGVIGLPWVHALREPVEEGELGGEAEDGRQPVSPSGQEDRGVVPAQPSPADAG